MNTKLCSIEGCRKARFSYGYCMAHANNFKRRGDPLKEPERKIGVHAHCTHGDCVEAHYGKGLCRIHWRRKYEDNLPMDKAACEVCGSTETRRAGTRFCSNACSQQWHRDEGSASRGAVLLRRGACSVQGCAEPIHAGQMCDVHYHRNKAHGDPHANPFVPALETCTRCGAKRGKVDVKRQGSRDLCGNCYGQDYYYINHVRERSRRNSRRSYQRRQTPKWANLEFIAKFYADCPEGYEVDHFYPLRGRKVSGLHVEGNLQYLPMSDNRKKGNRNPSA